MRNDLIYFDQMVDCLRGAVRDGRSGLGDVPGLLTKVLKEGMWRRRLVMKTQSVQEFARFEDFVTTPPLEGLGANMALIKRLAAGDSELLDLIDRETQTPNGIHTAVHIVNSSAPDVRPWGNSGAYALRRLRTQRPDLHARVIAGELSPNAAMVAAGFRERMLQIPLDPTRAARVLARHFSLSDIAQHWPTETSDAIVR